MNTAVRFLTLLSLLTGIVPARAGDTPAAPQLITPTVTDRASPFVTFNVDFPGGPLSQLITALSKIEGISLNIIGVDEAADFPRVELPAFSLRNVTLFTLTEVLRSFVEPRGFVLRPIGGPNPNSLVMMLNRIEARKAPAHAPNEFQSFRLYPFLEVQTVDDIVGAIRAGWELDPAHDPKALKLKYHAGTSILLVSGPSDALRVTEAVFRQLKRNPEVPPKPDPKNPSVPEVEKK